VAGSSHSCDLWWTAEETADDRNSWGETTTRTLGLATRKESRNGVAKWCLAGGECTAASYLGKEKSYAKGRKLWLAGGIYSRSRERDEAVPHVGDKTPTLSRMVAPWCTSIFSILGC
jgi:hypothetical protein